MNAKTTLRTTGFAALLMVAGPAIALAQGGAATSTPSNRTGTPTTGSYATPGTANSTGTSSAMTTTGTTAESQMQTHMTKNEVESALKAEGYSDITNLKESDGHYTANAKRYGQEEHNLKIDASTGKVMDQQALNEKQVKNLLKDQGYSDISNVKHKGNEFTASAKKNGSEQHVTVDAQSGMVSPQAG